MYTHLYKLLLQICTEKIFYIFARARALVFLFLSYLRERDKTTLSALAMLKLMFAFFPSINCVYVYLYDTRKETCVYCVRKEGCVCCVRRALALI